MVLIHLDRNRERYKQVKKLKFEQLISRGFLDSKKTVLR